VGGIIDWRGTNVRLRSHATGPGWSARDKAARREHMHVKAVSESTVLATPARWLLRRLSESVRPSVRIRSVLLAVLTEE
jgi:hypothetical protein